MARQPRPLASQPLMAEVWKETTDADSTSGRARFYGDEEQQMATAATNRSLF